MNVTINISDDKVSVSSSEKSIAPQEESEIIHKGVKGPEIAMDDIRRANIGNYFITELCNGETVRFDCVSKKDGFVRFDSHDCAIKSQWNEDRTNKGGYVKSLIRKNVDNFMYQLPKELQKLIAEAPRRCFDGESICEFQTKLFMPDEGELFDDEDIYNDRLYNQLDWYKDRRNRMKGEAFGKDTVAYWTASAVSGTSTNIVIVYSDGYSDDNVASNANRVPVCFLVNAECNSAKCEA